MLQVFVKQSGMSAVDQALLAQLSSPGYIGSPALGLVLPANRCFMVVRQHDRGQFAFHQKQLESSAASATPWLGGAVKRTADKPAALCKDLSAELEQAASPGSQPAAVTSPVTPEGAHGHNEAAANAAPGVQTGSVTDATNSMVRSQSARAN